MKRENVIHEKSFKFAIRIIKKNATNLAIGWNFFQTPVLFMKLNLTQSILMPLNYLKLSAASYYPQKNNS